MRRRREKRRLQALLGDGLSFEEVLTVITVLLLLRVVFMVPMVNLDKAKTVSASTDAYWGLQAAHVLGRETEEEEIRPYRAAFGIRGEKAVVTRSRDAVYVEAAAPDSSLLVIRHVPAAREFVALRVQGRATARSFRRGRLLWSQAEREWFVGSDTVDYGSHPSSLMMEREFRKWTRTERGY